MSAATLLAEARHRAGLSVDELWAATGIPRARILRIERGEISPRVETLERLLEACGFSLGLDPTPGFRPGVKKQEDFR